MNMSDFEVYITYLRKFCDENGYDFERINSLKKIPGIDFLGFYDNNDIIVSVCGYDPQDLGVMLGKSIDKYKK